MIESVLPGPADSGYLRVAGDEQARLIVLAAGRRPSRLRWLRRSAPSRMAARTRTPLVVLRQPERLRAWLLGVRPLKVVVAYNLTATANAALRWVNELRRAGPCEVVLVYANHPVEDYVRIGARGPLPFGDNPADVLAVLKRDMKARARAVLGNVPVRCRIEPDAARTHVRLAELAREERADLIVAGARQFTGWKRLVHGSVSRNLLHTAATNVAIIPFTPTPPFRIPTRHHILVATDFSAVGNAAVPHALSLLSDGGILTLMHVRSMPPAIREATRRDSGRNAELSSKADRIIAGRLRRLVPADAADRGILTQIEVPVTHAEPGEAISQAAERLGVDAICLGTGSRSELSRAFLGSVTRTVRSLTRRPLLLVPAARL